MVDLNDIDDVQQLKAIAFDLNEEIARNQMIYRAVKERIALLLERQSSSVEKSSVTEDDNEV